MRPAEIDSLLQDGIALAQAGQRYEARRMLQQVIEADPNRALAWMWLATVSNEREKRIEFLQRALALDPANETARMAYEQLTGEIFVGPDAITGSPAAPTKPAQPRLGAMMVGVVVLAFAVAAFILVLLFDNEDQSVGQSERMSTTTFEALLTPRSQTPEPRNSLVPTRTRTPRPTQTPGPSPTSIWDAPPPTWTIQPTTQPSATWTLPPSSTPNPSPIPFVAPAVRTVTAAFAHTSDAPLEARQSATAAISQTHAAQTASSTPTPTASETINSLRATVDARFTQSAATSSAIRTEIAATQTARAR